MPNLQLATKLNIHYLEISPQANPTVVLLHGLGSTSQSWLLQIPELGRVGYRVIAPDVRGFGKSTFPGGKTNIAIMAGDTASLIEYTQASPASLVGISMGGAIGLQLALDYPHLVQKLVLVNTFACLRPKRFSTWLYFAMRFLLVHTLGLPTQARAVARRIFPADEQSTYREMLVDQITQANPTGYRATMRALARFDVRCRLGEINIPTLVITGECDNTVPPANQAQFIHLIPGANQVIIPNAGHAVSVDSPDDFNRELLKFLSAS